MLTHYVILLQIAYNFAVKDKVGVRFHVDLNKGYFAFLAYSYAISLNLVICLN